MSTKSVHAIDFRDRYGALLVLGIACALAIALAGCGPTSPSSSQDASSSSAPAPVSSSSSAPAVQPAPSAAASSSAVEEPSSSEAESSSQEAAATTALGDYLSERWASFDAFDEGIRSGGSIPPSLRLYIPGEFDGYVHDQNTIADTWNVLRDLQVGAEPSENPGIEDGLMSFGFDSHSEVVAFDFCTNEYATPADGEFYAVQDPEALAELVESIRSRAQAEWQASGGLVNENGVYLWDADDDGAFERLRLDFTDNGDEARSVMTFTLEKEGAEPASVSVEGMYSVDTLAYARDDAGPHLIMRYTEGDYYNHTTVAEGKLRLVDGALTVELGN